MSRRRHRRKHANAQRATPPPQPTPPPPTLVRHASQIERLAYTRTQAAEALGISRTTLARLLPYIETIELPWGTQLIPVDGLERLLAERRRPARQRAQPATRGRPPAVPKDVADQIRNQRAVGKSFRQIADELNASGTPTSHGGSRWWASTVRNILARA